MWFPMDTTGGGHLDTVKGRATRPPVLWVYQLDTESDEFRQ